MPTEDESKILPPMMNDRGRPQANRTVLGVLLAVLFVAIVLALWFLLFDGDDDEAAGPGDGQGAVPTPLTIATSTPLPDPTSVAATVAAQPTTPPVATPTPLPEGLEACAADQAPSLTATYVVDTNTTPLNQRAEPAVSAPQAGTFDPGQSDLVFNGECVVNTTDGYVWWQIDNGTADVWIASDFVSPN